MTLFKSPRSALEPVLRAGVLGSPSGLEAILVCGMPISCGDLGCAAGEMPLATEGPFKNELKAQRTNK